MVDASGFAAMLSRKNGWWRPMPEHPTASVWTRWKGEGLGRPQIRRTVSRLVPQPTTGSAGPPPTIIGDGWWSWWIPSKAATRRSASSTTNGSSISPGDGGNIGDRLKEFLMRHPVAREMICDATYEAADLHGAKSLPYTSERYGRRIRARWRFRGVHRPVLQPGMDWVSFSASCSADLIAKSLAGGDTAMLVENTTPPSGSACSGGSTPFTEKSINTSAVSS
ncbi:MAG: hypothetical protein H7A50_13565 [Akkermansiaceae bacterium]|nr:hypothetical protein [Akkermansiaceae bacterium]